MKGAWGMKGLEEWLANVQQAGVDVDAATARAVDAGADIALAGMRKRVRKRTGRLAAHLAKGDVVQDGNTFSVDVGLLDLGQAGANYGKPRKTRARKGRSSKQWPRQFLYGIFQEFGTPRMTAQPYIRPTFDSDKSKIRKAEAESLKKDGTI